MLKKKFLITSITLAFVLFAVALLVVAASGDLDLSFDPGTGADDTILDMALQDDGKIVIVGEFSNYDGVPRSHIARVNADGSLDTSFDPVLGADSDIYAVALQSDGKIIIGGVFTTYNGTGINYLARINTDGSLDGTFNVGVGPDFYVWALAVQPLDDKIVISGYFNSYDSAPVGASLARVNADGTIDNTFDSGAGLNDTALGITIQPDGKFILTGNFSTYEGVSRNFIARGNTDGSLDTSFNPGTGFDQITQMSALQSDGKVVVASNATTYNSLPSDSLVRLNTDGSLDGTFVPGVDISNAVSVVAVTSDDEIILHGVDGLFKLGVDGSLDPDFDPGTGILGGFINKILVQEDGLLVLGGEFVSYDGVSRNGIARISVVTDVDNNDDGNDAQGGGQLLGSGYIMPHIHLRDSNTETSSRIVDLAVWSPISVTRYEVSNTPDFLIAEGHNREGLEQYLVWDICKGVEVCSAGAKVIYARFYMGDNLIREQALTIDYQPSRECPYFKMSLRKGSKKNNPDEVRKVQEFLNTEMGKSIVVDGVFGQETDKVVRDFQTKYPEQILSPWPGLFRSTGWWYVTTPAFANTLVGCR